MSQVLSEQWQNHLVSTVDHWAMMGHESVAEAAAENMRPSVLFKPTLSIDGNQWCALYGDNLQDGVAGFGDSPDDAMRDFDYNWLQKLSVKGKQ